MRNLVFRGGVLSAACSLILAWSCGSITASNPWASEVGEARSVQSKTEDIAERLSDDFPFSAATRPALHLDNIARQLESAVKSGCSWNQIQSLLHQTCSAGQQVHVLVANDCQTRTDRRLTGYFGELNQRLDKLDQELLEALQKQTRPVCVVPLRPAPIVPYSSFYPETYRGHNAWNTPIPAPGNGPIFGRKTAPEMYRENGYREELLIDPREMELRGNHELGPRDFRPMPSPSFPPGAEIGPIQYRTSIPNRSDSPIARQVLSAVLAEIANRL